MSKELGEIIKEFKGILKDYPDHKPLNNALNRLCSFLLSELEPVQYFVEITKDVSCTGEVGYFPSINGREFEFDAWKMSKNEAKKHVLSAMNYHATFLALPPITIDQITFIETVTPQ